MYHNKKNMMRDEEKILNINNEFTPLRPHSTNIYSHSIDTNVCRDTPSTCLVLLLLFISSSSVSFVSIDCIYFIEKIYRDFFIYINLYIYI